MSNPDKPPVRSGPRGTPLCVGILMLAAMLAIPFALYSACLHKREQNAGLSLDQPRPKAEVRTVADAEFVPTPTTFSGSSKNLKETALQATLDEPIPPGRNAIWCSTFCLAWNLLKADAKEPILLAGAEAHSARLNANTASEEDLEAKDRFIAVATPGGRKGSQVAADFSARFPGQTALWPCVGTA